MGTQTTLNAAEIAKWLGIIAGFGAVVIPQITELLKRYKWPKWAHVLIAVVLAGLTGICSVTVTPASMHDPAALAELAAVAWASAVVAYHAAWAPSGVSDAIGRRTGSLPPIQPAADGSYAITRAMVKSGVVPVREVRAAVAAAAAVPAPVPAPQPEPEPEPELASEPEPVAPEIPDPEPVPAEKAAKRPAKKAAKKPAKKAATVDPVTGEHRTR